MSDDRAEFIAAAMARTTQREPGASVERRRLLEHAGGVAFDQRQVMARLAGLVGRRASATGAELLGIHLDIAEAEGERRRLTGEGNAATAAEMLGADGGPWRQWSEKAP